MKSTLSFLNGASLPIRTALEHAQPLKDKLLESLEAKKVYLPPEAPGTKRFLAAVRNKSDAQLFGIYRDSFNALNHLPHGSAVQLAVFKTFASVGGLQRARLANLIQAGYITTALPSRAAALIEELALKAPSDLVKLMRSDKPVAPPPVPTSPTEQAATVSPGSPARQWLGHAVREQTRSWDRVIAYLKARHPLKPGEAGIILRRMQATAQTTLDQVHRSAFNVVSEGSAPFPAVQIDNVLRKLVRRTPTTPIASTVQSLAALSWLYAEGYAPPGVETRVANAMRDDLRRAILTALVSSTPRQALAKVMAEYIPDLQ